MDIETLEDAIPEYDPLKFPVSIAFTEAEFKRWHALKAKLNKVNSRLKLTNFARDSLKKMMDDVERLVDQVKTD